MCMRMCNGRGCWGNRIKGDVQCMCLTQTARKTTLEQARKPALAINLCQWTHWRTSMPFLFLVLVVLTCSQRGKAEEKRKEEKNCLSQKHTFCLSAWEPLRILVDIYYYTYLWLCRLAWQWLYCRLAREHHPLLILVRFFFYEPKSEDQSFVNLLMVMMVNWFY